MKARGYRITIVRPSFPRSLRVSSDSLGIFSSASLPRRYRCINADSAGYASTFRVETQSRVISIVRSLALSRARGRIKLKDTEARGCLFGQRFVNETKSSSARIRAARRISAEIESRGRLFSRNLADKCAENNGGPLKLHDSPSSGSRSAFARLREFHLAFDGNTDLQFIQTLIRGRSTPLTSNESFAAALGNCRVT